MQTPTLASPHKEQLLSIFTEQPEGGFAARQEALGLVEELPFPSPKHEEWKFTNPAPLFKEAWEVPEAQGEKLGFDEFGTLEGHRLVFRNGQFCAQSSQILPEEDGIILKNLRQAEQENIPEAAAHFGKYLPKDLHLFAALNTALFQDGIFLYVPQGKVMRHPIWVLHQTDAPGRRSFVQMRHLLVAEANSQAKIIELHRTSEGSTSFLNLGVEGFVGDGAQVSHYRLQDDSAKASQVTATEVKVGRQANFKNLTVSTSGQLLRNDLRYQMGEGSEAHMIGLYLPDTGLHVDNHTVADHQLPHAMSNELYKGVLYGKGKAVFNGKIFVREGAQKTNAFQSNRNVLLSDEAVIHTKPQLEIWADDVKCSHGATTGALDTEALFYLRSRGIPERAAKQVLLHAFAAEILDYVDLEVLKSHVEKLIVEKV